MKLFTEIATEHHELPDHIEIGVRIAGMKFADAKALQQAAAANSTAVRFELGIEPVRLANGRELWANKPYFLEATARMAREQYAYARYLRGIDDYWLTLQPRQLKERTDYIIDRMSAPLMPIPALDGPAGATG